MLDGICFSLTLINLGNRENEIDKKVAMHSCIRKRRLYTLKDTQLGCRVSVLRAVDLERNGSDSRGGFDFIDGE